MISSFQFPRKIDIEADPPDFPGGSDGKASAYNVEAWVRSLGQEDPLEKEMAPYSSILAWEVPWTGLVGYSLWGHEESDMTEVT